jgi:membrane fusion protein (multidrug efflux system)
MKPLQRIAAFLAARRAWLAAGLLAASGALVGVGFAMRGAGGRISTDDAFVEGPAIFLAARVAGQVLEAPVEEHARVRRGDLLARLDPADFQARVARAEADLAAAHNRVASAHAEAALREAKLALEHAEVRAPFDGVVGRKNVEPGAIVSPGQPLL